MLQQMIITEGQRRQALGASTIAFMADDPTAAASAATRLAWTRC